jgi:hypothetical protein
MAAYVTGSAGKTTWRTPTARWVGVGGSWVKATGRWVGASGHWLRYWPKARQLYAVGEHSATWALAPVYTLTALWGMLKATGTWFAMSARDVSESPFYHYGARRWMLAQSSGLWIGPNDITSTVTTTQPGWTNIHATDFNFQNYYAQYTRRYVNLANGNLLIQAASGTITTVGVSGDVVSVVTPPHTSHPSTSFFFESNGVAFYSTGNYLTGFPVPTLAFSATPEAGGWTTVNVAQFPGWYYMMGGFWDAATSTHRIVLSVATGSSSGLFQQQTFSSPDGVTWTEIVGARHGLTYGTCNILRVGSCLLYTSDAADDM